MNGNGHDHQQGNGSGQPGGNGNGHAPSHAGGNGKADKPTTEQPAADNQGLFGLKPRRKKSGVRPRKGEVKQWEPIPRDLEVYHHITSGKTCRETGKLMDLSESGVTRIVKRVDAWLAPQYLDSIRELKANHVERLMHIYHEAMAAWERSKLPADSVSVKDVAVKTTAKVSLPAKEVTRNRRWQSGNSQYLAEARDALADIRRILGADAPLKVEHSGEIRVAGQQLSDVISEAKTRLGDSMRRLAAFSKTSLN
jgi:hypothetical protein